MGSAFGWGPRPPGRLGIPLEEVWLLAVGERVVDLDEAVEGPLEVYPPIAGGGILGVLP